MSKFLLFTVYAPFASWGEIAVGETRGSWNRPSRSAVLGLIAASFGIDRGDQDAHDALSRGYGVAVRLDAAGYSLTDYHTAQTVGESVVRKARPRTRKALLEAGALQTILSRRTYRQDALATCALWIEETPFRPLEGVQAALQRPHFVLYAGRKANALGLPLSPEIVEAQSLAAALAKRGAPPGLDHRRLLGGRTWGKEVSFDSSRRIESGIRSERRDVRRDISIDRRRMQFAERVVEVGEGSPIDDADSRVGAP